MRRWSRAALPITVILTIALVLAGCVQPAPGGDGTAVTPQGTDAPPLPPASASSNTSDGSSDTWAPDVEPCVEDVHEPRFDGDAEVSTRTEPVGANITRAVVRVQSYLGGIYLAPWIRDEAQVQVGESDPDDVLEPHVTITTRGDTLVVDVRVEQQGQPTDGPLGLDLFTEPDTYAAVKVRLPDLPVERVVLRDIPERNGSDEDPTLWFRTDWGEGGWREIVAHDIEARSFATKASVLDTTVTRVRATAAALSTGSGNVHVHRFAARNATVDGGSSDLCASRVTAPTLSLDAGSGSVDARGVDAERFRAETGSGDITLQKVRARSASVDAGSGDLHLEHVLFQRLDADTGSGTVEGDLVPTATGSLEVSGGSGDVTLRFPAGPNLGYRVHASAGSGDVTVHITNGTVNESGEERGGEVTGSTRGFDQRPVRVQVSVGTGSGDILVEA